MINFQLVRKAIAKVLTVLSEKRIDTARTAFKNKKYTPHDLRHKKTRAFRRRLSSEDAKRMTLKAQKKAENFKLRKFALAA